MKKLISASRRTDIPAFYSRWFMNRIRAGFCHWINPFGGQVYRVSLAPEDVYGIVFWTRHPGPMLQHIDELESRGFRFYFHVTVNGYGSLFEPRNPAPDVVLDSIRKLSRRVSPDRVIWRYDPVILSRDTPPPYHASNFARLARELQGCTSRCIFSFVDLYGKTARNLKRIDPAGTLSVIEGDPGERNALAAELASIAGAHGITLHACCEDALVGPAVGKAQCVGTSLLGVEPLNLAPSRAECGCMASVDIGAYDTCQFGCVYCYATNSWEAARRRAMRHDPADSALWRPARELPGNSGQHPTGRSR